MLVNANTKFAVYMGQVDNKEKNGHWKLGSECFFLLLSKHCTELVPF
jgi:hypothetical protein